MTGSRAIDGNIAGEDRHVSSRVGEDMLVLALAAGGLGCIGGTTGVVGGVVMVAN